jgi:hypothetical protein
VNPYDEVVDEAVVELDSRRSIFIGFKLDSGLRRQLETLGAADQKYVSKKDSTFLRICRVDGKPYVGKLIHERLTTDRVEDIQRNIASILQRVCPDIRLPQTMEVLPGPSEN